MALSDETRKLIASANVAYAVYRVAHDRYMSFDKGEDAMRDRAHDLTARLLSAAADEDLFAQITEINFSASESIRLGDMRRASQQDRQRLSSDYNAAREVAWAAISAELGVLNEFTWDALKDEYVGLGVVEKDETPNPPAV